MGNTKHTSKNRLFFSQLNSTLNVIEKVGIRINLYYVFVEGLFGRTQQKFEGGSDEYEITLLGPQDMKAISAPKIFDRKETEEYLLNRLKR